MSFKTIMVVGAHHDDNELVAGTLAHHKKAGWRVVSVVMTNGVYIAGKVSKEHTAIRESESCAAAELLGIECVFMRFPEGDFHSTDESRLTLLREIRKHSPTIVITHSPTDYHFDHIGTSRCVTEAVQIAWNPCVLPDVPTCTRPKLYYADNWFTPFEPDEYVDITDYIDLKLDMLRCHKSQLSTTGENSGDMIDLARRVGRTRGIEAGLEYAEAFRLVPAFGKVRCSNLLNE